ncbi:hypothetical protein DFQ28_005306 [Apophysomyces sp. BC1034]|nr:hypothetical protein DFQ30_006136 [Apophysomyces sp. BC1015]KAG0188160.1 hypothetical protein DFQ28_005306 [Apophysomyces sp. BC1034]
MSNRYQQLPTAEDPLDSQSVPDLHHTTTALPNSPVSTAHSATLTNSRSVQQRIDLEETFDESIGDHDNEESQRLLRPANHPRTSELFSASETPTLSSISDRPAVLPVTNDGVFSNMSAKPESETKLLDETPPAYEEAAADSTPPYWQTTIIAPSGYEDLVLVDGMPVGSLFSFAWNLLGGTLMDEYIDGDGSNGSPKEHEDESDADIVAYFLMILGWFIILRAIVDYARAQKMEKIISAEPTAESIV